MRNPNLTYLTRWNLIVGGVYGVYGETYRVEVLDNGSRLGHVKAQRRDTGEVIEVAGWDLV
jgi:hypothetical protein